MTSLSDKIKSLRPPTEKVKNGKEITPPKKNGGKRPGSGRKPKEVNIIARGIKDWMDTHMNEKVDVRIKDPKTGKERIIKKTRLMYAMEKLYSMGTSGEGNADAVNKWMDRVLGKPLQKVVGDETEPIVVRIDF